MDSGKVLIGVLAGFAAGALIGILFAPDKGTNTRKQILSSGEDYADILKEKFDEVVNNLSKKYDNAKGEAEDLAAKGKDKYNEVKQDVKSAAANSFNSK